MTTALSDTFTDANGTALSSHTMDVGTGWTIVQGTMQIQSNKCTSGSNNDDDRAAADSGQADFTLTYDVTSAYTNSGNFSTADMMYRYQDSSNYWLLLNAPYSSQFVLYERNAGTYNQRTTFSTFGQLSGETHTNKIVTAGTLATFYLDGTSVGTYTSSSFQTATKVGPRISKNGSPGGTATWDNILVTYTGGGGGVFVRYYYDMIGGG